MFGDWQEIREEHLEATDQPEESILLAKEILNENYQINQTDIEDKAKAVERYPETMNRARMHAAGYHQQIPNVDLSRPEDYIPKITTGLELEPEQEDQVMQNAITLAEFMARENVRFNGIQPNPKTEAAGLTYVAANNKRPIGEVTQEEVAKTIEGVERGQIQRFNSIVKGNSYPDYLKQGEKRITNEELQKQLQKP